MEASSRHVPQQQERHGRRLSFYGLVEPPAQIDVDAERSRLLESLSEFNREARITKKRSEARKHGALAVVRRSQKVSPRRRPTSRGIGRPKSNQLETVTTCTYKPNLVRIDARNFELSW